MKGILSVFRFTFLEHVKKKSFIISTVVLCVLILAVFCVPAVIGAFQNSENPPAQGGQTGQEKNKSVIYLIDDAKLVAGSTDKLEAAMDGYRFKVKPASEKDALIEKVKTGNNESLAVLSQSGENPSLTLYVKNITAGPSEGALGDAVKKVYSETLLTQAGVSPQIIEKADAQVQSQSIPVGRGTVGGIVSSFAVTLLLFFAIYMYGYWVAISIASEKTTRVMEMLITSTKPSTIVIGKSLAMGALGLSQMLALLLVGGLSYSLVFPKDFTMGGMAINLSGFTPLAIFLMLVYFVFGFSLYAMLYAVCGATVSRAEDTQQAIMPVAMLSVISFYFSYSTAAFSDSTVSVVASLVPFSAPFAMPSRFLSAELPAWQLIVSVLLLAGTTALMAAISIRLYESAVLHYGKRLKISELVKLSKAH